MHQMNRSDLMECLEFLAGQAKSVPEAESVPAVDVKILDGAAIVHTQRSRDFLSERSRTIHNWFLPYVENVLQDVSRIDIV